MMNSSVQLRDCYYSNNGADCNRSLSNLTYPPYDSYDSANTQPAVSEIAQFIVNGIIVPSIGVLGVLGNLLNVVILSWRCSKRDDDALEKVALVGLISLSVSDMCFCITVLPGFIFWKQLSFDKSRSFGLLYHAYGGYLQNVFIKTSTWLTMIVATARYVAICHPLRARMCFGLTSTKVAILLTYAFWIIFLLPILWEFKIIEYQMDENSNVYVIDFGPVSMNNAFKVTCAYTWAVVGYFIPITILAYCNVCLILALRESRLLQEKVTNRTGKTSTRQANRRITLTLIMLVLMFFLLVSPSELLQFCTQITSEIYTVYELAILVTNVLQAINFSCHFVLYCCVNATFRRTLVSIGFYLLSLVQSSRMKKHTRSRESSSVTRRSTCTHYPLRSTETSL